MFLQSNIRLRHFISFFVFLFIFVVLFYFLTITSPSYEVAKYNLQNNEKIIEITGSQSSIKVDFFRGMDLTADLAYIYFKIKGVNGYFDARVFLREDKKAWRTCEITLYKEAVQVYRTTNTCV